MPWQLDAVVATLAQSRWILTPIDAERMRRRANMGGTPAPTYLAAANCPQ